MSIYERTIWVFVFGCTCLWVGAYVVLKDGVLTKHNSYALALVVIAYLAFHFLGFSPERRVWPRLLALVTGLYCVYESNVFWGHYTLQLGWCAFAVGATFYLALLGRYGRFTDIWQQAKRNRAARLARKQHAKAVKSQDKITEERVTSTGIGDLVFEH